MGVSVLLTVLRPVLEAVAATEVLSGHFLEKVRGALENAHLRPAAWAGRRGRAGGERGRGNGLFGETAIKSW